MEIPDVDEVQLMNIFNTIAKTISQSIKESPDIGGKTLASIHYKLFLDQYEKKSEKSRLALMYLQSQLGALICEAGKNEDIGMLIFAYTRHWLHFVLILESQMSTYLSWYTFKKELPRSLVPIISTIEETIPIVVEKDNPGLPEDLIRDFRKFADAANDDAGKELKNWLNELMREVLYNNDDYSLQTLLQFMKSSSELFNVSPIEVEFNTVFHQYAEAWFHEILERKKWINNLITKLELFDEKNIYRLSRGYYWRKLGDVSFGDIIKQKKQSLLKNELNPVQLLQKQLQSSEVDLKL